MENIPRGLKKAIEKDELVLFIGAGLSCELKNTEGTALGGWKEMVLSMLSYLNKEDYITDEEQKSYEKLDPIDALKKLEEKDEPIGKEEVGDFIKCYFELEKGNDLSLQRDLFSLSTKIITTNYDIALEEAAPELKSKKAYKTKGFELEKIRNNPTFLFKLHGCIEDLKSLILFPSDYDDLYNSKSQDAEQVLKALDNLIYNKTFLFIGTGMGDPQITSFFEKIKSVKGKHSQKHYIITPKPLNKSLNFLTRIEINDYAEIPSVIKQLLDIKKAADAKKNSKEKLLLEQLIASKTEKALLAKGLDKERNKNKRQTLLLEREANNRFLTGLKHHIAKEYLEAIEEYKAATELKPEYSEAYYNWGVALMGLAKTKSGNEAEELYKEACKKYDKAITYKQDYHEAYYNWGVALMELAEIKSGNEAEELYKEAFEKYKLATTYKQDDHNTYDAWGLALVELAKTKSGSEAEELLNEAIKKFQQAVEYGGDAYHLANLYGLIGKKAEALKYLDIALSRNEITINFVEQDEDWEEFRNDPDFQNLLSRYKK